MGNSMFLALIFALIAINYGSTAYQENPDRYTSSTSTEASSDSAGSKPNQTLKTDSVKESKLKGILSENNETERIIKPLSIGDIFVNSTEFINEPVFSIDPPSGLNYKIIRRKLYIKNNSPDYEYRIRLILSDPKYDVNGSSSPSLLQEDVPKELSPTCNSTSLTKNVERFERRHPSFDTITLLVNLQEGILDDPELAKLINLGVNNLKDSIKGFGSTNANYVLVNVFRVLSIISIRLTNFIWKENSWVLNIVNIFLQSIEKNIEFCEIPLEVSLDVSQKDKTIIIQNPNLPSEVASVEDVEDAEFFWNIELINANKVWEYGEVGSSSIKVAVIDSGLDIVHPAISSNLYNNPDETYNNSDDDNNGYVDDIFGYNFATQTAFINDISGHGTHVSGIIGGKLDGIYLGVCPEVSIATLSHTDAAGRSVAFAALAAIAYAAEINSYVISCSWGTSDRILSLETAMKNLQSARNGKGILVIAAAGNDGVNNDSFPIYPASYEMKNVISVGATTEKNLMADFSNYGVISVDIAAPGEKILSTLPGGYGYKSGTSMSTPHVTGVAALVYSFMLKRSYEPYYNEMKGILLHSSKSLESLGGRVKFGAQIDAYSAIQKAELGGVWINVDCQHVDFILEPSKDTIVDISMLGFDEGTYSAKLNVQIFPSETTRVINPIGKIEIPISITTQSDTERSNIILNSTFVLHNQQSMSNSNSLSLCTYSDNPKILKNLLPNNKMSSNATIVIACSVGAAVIISILSFVVFKRYRKKRSKSVLEVTDYQPYNEKEVIYEDNENTTVIYEDNENTTVIYEDSENIPVTYEDNENTLNYRKRNYEVEQEYY